MERVLIIVPAYNEELSLPATLKDLRNNCPHFDVVVINDASRDNTRQVAESCGAKVLSLPINLGIGGAMQTGFLWAHQNGYSAAVQFDGDGQHQAKYIPEIVKPLLEGEADMVVGSRYLNSDPKFETTLFRRSGMVLFSWFFRVASQGMVIKDTTSGFRALNAKTIRLFVDNYSVDFPEMPALLTAIRSGIRIKEVQVEMSQRQHGVSSIGIGKTLKALLAGLAVLLRRRVPT